MLSQVGFGQITQKKAEETFAVDSNGKVRLIERDIHSKDPLLNETVLSNDFEWVCKALSKEEKDSNTDLDFYLIDTVK